MPREQFTLAPSRPAARAAERLFRRERLRIQRRLPGAVIHHVGATSVRNLPTKGDLDIVVRVAPSELAAADRALSGLYNRNTKNTRTDEFSSFLNNDTSPPLGVQLVAIGSEHDDFDLLRDQLRVSPLCRRKLARLKHRFHGRSMSRYRSAKAILIAEISVKEPLATLLATRRSRSKQPKT
ncbi:MAG: GrpB family protein [Phycisphaerales bacterium]